MTEDQSHPHTGHLTSEQQTRIDFARRDLETARATDLAQLPPAGLILLVERLRRRLDDVLNLVTEACETPPLLPPDHR